MECDLSMEWEPPGWAESGDEYKLLLSCCIQLSALVEYTAECSRKEYKGKCPQGLIKYFIMWFGFDNNNNFPFGSQRQTEQFPNNMLANLFGFPAESPQESRPQQRQRPNSDNRPQQRQDQRPRQQPQQQRPPQQRQPPQRQPQP